MECVEAALLFERNEAMALHYQSTVRRWKGAPDDRMASWTLRPEHAQEFHSCLTEPAKLPSAVEDMWNAKIWSRFRRHCRNFRSKNSNQRFDEEKFKQHKRQVLNWTYRAAAYTALYGDTPRPLHIEMMDAERWLFIADENPSRWIFLDGSIIAAYAIWRNCGRRHVGGQV
jgi:hypothetical protein